MEMETQVDVKCTDRVMNSEAQIKTDLVPHFKSFSDLEHSKLASDRAIFTFVNALLIKIFGNSKGELVINKNIESEANQLAILEEWHFIERNFVVPKRVKNLKKVVRQTLKYIIEDLNQSYGFEIQIDFKPQSSVFRNEDGLVSLNQTKFQLY